LSAPNLANPIKPWENEHWTPAPLFLGQTVFCLASGPSMSQEIADKVPADRSIVVNGTSRLKPDARVLYFTDNGWYMANRALIESWPGLVVSMSRMAKRELDDPALGRPRPRILRIKGHGAPPYPPRWQGKAGFPPVGHPEPQQGRNSGNTAVGLAIAMGAARVILLGYDCRVVNGREHHHSDYSGPRDLSLYDNEFLRAFDGWREAAIASGVEIVNSTPGSAITEFPFRDLDEVLACDRA
jgi:hypothetical protein